MPEFTKYKTCKWSKYDETWGEYKCKYFYRRMYDLSCCETCKSYEEKKELKEKELKK